MIEVLSYIEANERGEMAGIFKSMKRVLTGSIIRQSDVSIMNGGCVMSLRMKRERGGGTYVVLAATALGNHQYYAFEANEFEKFIEAAVGIRDAMTSSSSAEPKSSL